jgi:polyisoprenoid-binding protein YceI
MKTITQKNNFKTWIKVLALLLIAMGSYGQTNYKQSGATTVTIAGTSTMHDWTMTSQGANYNAGFEVNADGTPSVLNTVSVTVPAESLKSKETAMDKNAYKSLKTDKFKDITFQLTTAKIVQKTITCTGNLTIAGTTKPIDVDVVYEVKNGNLVCKGSKKIKMTDFKVDPPTFMFGAIKTGDEITISFDVTLAPIKL